jgi:streptogramin lyase
MRLNSAALGLLLPGALLFSGCAMQNSAGTAVSAISPAKMISGKVHGGQQPVANGLIALYAYGTSGYGSAGQVLAATTADSTGYFTIDPSQIQCPTPTTPVYILSIGGDPGFGPNSAITLGSGLGQCQNAAQAFVTINEISTAALAYTFSHFFSAAATGDANTNDHFGGPASATGTISNGNTGTLNTILDVENGYPHPNSSTFAFEGQKLITIANILGSCVNSGGPTSPSCRALFRNISGPNGATPANTLEAAAYLALNPTQNVANVFALQPPSGAGAFTGGLTTAPADWTLSASYTSPNFGLAVNNWSVSTIDIDTSGRVWFPSNGSGNAGVAYFDPSAGQFSSLFTGNLTHPQQVAIDVDNYVWATDISSPNIAGFPANSPNNPVLLSLPQTTSQSVTVAYDNTIRFGIVNGLGLPALAEVSGKNSYFPVQNADIPGAYGFVASSIAGDVIGGFGLGGQQLGTPTTYDFYFSPSGQLTPVTYQSYQDAGQVVFTGNDFVGARGGYSPSADGICIWSAQNCFSMANQGTRHPSGLSLDGNGTLWLADNNGPYVEQVPLSNGTYLNGSNQANNTVILHDNNNGGTLIHPAGVAVDGAGNVWVSNFGCNSTGCTPGSFTLSELIGAGAPTITPVSRQVVINDLAGTQPQAKKATALPAK